MSLKDLDKLEKVELTSDNVSQDENIPFFKPKYDKRLYENTCCDVIQIFFAMLGVYCVFFGIFFLVFFPLFKTPYFQTPYG